jgi:hypothetical protein
LSRFSTPFLPDPLVACLNATSRPNYLIKHCLSHHIITLTASPSGNHKTLLPPDFANTITEVQQFQKQGSSTGKLGCTLRATSC